MGATQRSNGKWQARYSDNGTRINVGTYPTKKEALQAVEDHKEWHGIGYEETPISIIQYQPPKLTFLERVKNAFKNRRSNSK